MSPCAHSFVPKRWAKLRKSHQMPRFMLYLSSDPNLLDSKKYVMTSLIHISNIFLPYTPCVSTFSFLVFLALACFILTGSLKVWRYWLHISFWHTTKNAISHLHTGDWLTWQVSSLCIKRIKIVLHAAVVFNRNIIQLTQVFFRFFFHFT